MAATATRRRRSGRRPAAARDRRPDVIVRIVIPLGNMALEDRLLVRDTARMVIAARMNGAEVEQRADQGLVITVGYTGRVLNAGPTTAAAWALQCLDEAIPEDSPLAELLARGLVKVTTSYPRPSR